MSVADYPTLPDRVASPNGKLVVLYVQAYEAATVEQLHRELGLSTLTVLTVVERLAKRGVLQVEDGVVSMAGGT